MSVNMHYILQPTLLQHQHFPLSSTLWNKIPTLDPAFCCFTNQPHSETANISVFLRTKEKIPGTVTLGRRWSQSLFSVLLLQCWRLVFMATAWERRRKKRKRCILMKIQRKRYQECVFLAFSLCSSKIRMFALLSIKKSGQTALFAPQLTSTQGNLFQISVANTYSLMASHFP